MGGVRSDQIVASVMSRPDNHVVCSEALKSAFQNRRRQVWAIAVERDHGMLVSRREVCKNRGESRCKALTLLGHDLRSISQQARKLVHIRARTHESNLHPSQ